MISIERYDAVMYVVIHRSNSELDPVSFQSHMFAASKDAQAAFLSVFGFLVILMVCAVWFTI